MPIHNKTVSKTKYLPKAVFGKNEAEDEEGNPSENYLNFARRTRPVTQVSISIDEAIREPKYYRGVVQELSNLGEMDEVILYINSPGGRLDGLVSMLEAIRMCEADILAIITGDAHSAASMLALSCPNVAVTPFSNMLVHFVSFGAVGKAFDVVGNVQHTVEYSKVLFREIYQGFLSEDEIQDVIQGKELWLQSQDIEERLEARQRFLADKNTIDDDKEDQDDKIEVQVKPKRQRKVKPQEDSV